MSTLQPNIDTLVSTLNSNPKLPVIFTQNDHAISPGYHVTEVKMATVNSLDCGRGTDQWREIVIQLLDGNADTSGTYMQSAKMAHILNQALNGEQTDNNTELYFEFAIGNAALQKSTVSRIEIVNNTISISLNATIAQCKPYQRALASGKALTSGNSCCGSVVKQSQACCDTGSASIDSPCCT